MIISGDLKYKISNSSKLGNKNKVSFLRYEKYFTETEREELAKYI